MVTVLNALKSWKLRKSKPSRDKLSEIFRVKYEHFKELLSSNTELAKIIADMEEKLQGRQVFGMSYIQSQAVQAVFHTLQMAKSLDALSGHRYPVLFDVLEGITIRIKTGLEQRKEIPTIELTLPFSQITKEMVDWVGGKNANLGEILNRVNLPIPEGFAITTRAYELFLAGNDLVDEISKKKMELDPNDPETLAHVSEEIQKLIFSAPVPLELREAILSAYDQMIERVRQNNSGDFSSQVSMRSSAIGEDSELSHAGQYLSVLNVPREKLIQIYKYIIASLFTPRAISYRLNKGIKDEDIAMGVACFQMVESVASGIAYSRHPLNVLENNIIITAVWGLGPYAVEGIITPDSYTVAKDEGLSIIQTQVSHKPVQLMSNPEGGLIEVSVPVDKQEHPCLLPEQIGLLSHYAVKLEKHYGCPQDIEWALDEQGRIIILQTRPLRLETPDTKGVIGTIPRLTEYPLLVEKGAVAFPGVGSGKAFQVHTDEDLLNFPDGAVLVAKHSSPKFVMVMQKAQAIVTDFGSVTGHMASLSREFAVPTILDAKVATSSIPTGTEVTIDAYSGRVYQGKVPELLGLQAAKQSHLKDTPIYQTLKQIAEYIVPLRLFDPRSPAFGPEHCRSLHDIMRLVHEFSYAEMFRISDLVSEGEGWALKLVAPTPLDLYVIDLGGGLADVSEDLRKVTVHQVVSAPFKALLKGMLREDLRFQQPRPVELKGFLSVMSEQMFSNTYAAERFGDRSYAMVSDKYLNFSSRVGYHYGILDSYCGQTINKNYITFSFQGGAADDVRRNRRARTIALILKALDFSVDVMGDRVEARLKKYEPSVIEEKLDLVGRLLQFTRQMDMLMNSEASVEMMAKNFLEGNYNLD